MAKENQYCFIQLRLKNEQKTLLDGRLMVVVFGFTYFLFCIDIFMLGFCRLMKLAANKDESANLC